MKRVDPNSGQNHSARKQRKISTNDCLQPGSRRFETERKSPKITQQNLATERLPFDFLPNIGKVKVRPTVHTVTLYLNGPFGSRGEKIAIGSFKYSENWRRYDTVEFKSFHYLRVELSTTEKQKCRQKGIRNVTHGWCVYENRTKNIPRHKKCLPGRFYTYRKPTVLISLFDGIAGARVSMEGLPDQFKVIKAFSSEIDETAMSVSRRYMNDTVELGKIESISKLTIHQTIFSDSKIASFRQLAACGDEVHFVVVAGPPCQDLSRAKAVDGVTAGIFGKKSKLFFHVPRLISYITEELGSSEYVHFIVENVCMAPMNERIFSQFLNEAKPWKIDLNPGGCCASLMSRPRLYWCSPLPRGGDVGINDFLLTNCIHPAKSSGKKLEDVLSHHGLTGYEYCNKNTGKRVNHLPTLTRKVGNKGQDNYFIRKKSVQLSDSVDVNVQEGPQDINEDLLGFPVGHTKETAEGELLTEKQRRELLGNTFMVYHIRHLMLKMHYQIEEPRPRNISVMPPPQARCAQFLRQESTDNTVYEKIVDELNGMGFDKLDKASKGTLFECTGS